MQKSCRLASVILGCGVLLLPSLAYGQMQAPSSGSPRINHIGPVAGQAGTTFDLRVTGQDLNDAEGLHFNFPGVKVESAGSESTPAPMRTGKKGGGGKGMAAQGLTTHTFKVTLPANAPLGIQDVRIITKAGISNPRAFVVSDTKEFNEVEPNDDVPKAQKIELNSSVSGVISTPIDVDYFVFAGKKGQRVVCSCLSTSIDSRLPVAVQLYGADGTYLGNNRGYRDNDAVLDAFLPVDGDYFVRVYSFSHQLGGIDYFYRLTVSTAPWIDAVFPPVAQPGKDTQVTVYGRNLPGGKLDPTAIVNDRVLEKAVVTIKAPNDPQRLTYSGFIAPPSSMLDGFDFRMKNEAGSSNPFLITYAPALVVTETGANRESDKAQPITLPCVVAGRIDKKADRGWFTFTAQKGQVWNIEAFSERLGSPMDLFFHLYDDKGNRIVEQDDNLEILSPQFYTRTDDPAKYRFTVPTTGTYSLMVSSREAFTLYGPRHLYTVRITPEEPDFRLVATPLSQLAPEANTVNQAGGVGYNVYVWRLGGFNDEITLTGENLPPGIGVRPQRIGAGQKQAALVVHADETAKPWSGAIKIVGTATIKGQKVTREMRSATISWSVVQATIPTVTRLDRELVVAVRDKSPYRLILAKEKISVTQGEKISIPVKLIGGDNFKGSVQVSTIGGPAQLIAQVATINPGQDGTVTLDAKGGNPVPPGNYTIFLRGQTQPINPKQQNNPPKAGPPNLVQISLPVSVTVVPKSLGKLSAQPTTAKVSIGKDVEVAVRIARLYELPIGFKVEAILPANVKGITVKDAAIKADQDEVKLIFAVAPNAMIGANPSITIRATAMFNDAVPIVHETKVTLTITK